MRCVRNFVPLLLHVTVVTKNTEFPRRNTDETISVVIQPIATFISLNVAIAQHAFPYACMQTGQ